MAKFFIHRPIFAWVIAIGIMLAGAVSLAKLPISQYPNVASPTISINANYLGASAITVEQSVTQVIEESLKGIDNLLYMRSTSSNSGNANIQLTFNIGTDPDIAQVQVQNKLQLVTPSLPQEVQRLGVSVTKSDNSSLMALAIISEDGSMNQADLSDYANSVIRDQLSRIKGVGEVVAYGSSYAMRVWLDPISLYNYKMTPIDVINAIRAQNLQVTAGQLAALPASSDVQLNISIQGQTLLSDVKDFENILLRVESGGQSVFLKDVARVEIGSESYVAAARMNGKVAGGLSINLAAGANALDTGGAVKAKLEEMKSFLPEGVEIIIAYDTTPPIKKSMHEVQKTLIEAILIVCLIMLIFLQNIRTTIIPVIAIPVVLLGTFAVLALFGYTLNALTMFAMILAIGLLVDDAIVVVENVERIITEEKLPPVEAAEKAMKQVTSSLVGIVAVLSAVFIPMAFMSGSTGVIYRQFSVTIISAMVISLIVANVLTPALCATILKENHKEKSKKGVFGFFNKYFDKWTNSYNNTISRFLKHSARLMIIYVALVIGAIFLFMRLPTGFLPQEDQGIMLAMIQLPPNSTMQETNEVLARLEEYSFSQEADVVNYVLGVVGINLGGGGGASQNTATAFISLKDWSERTKKGQSAEAISARYRAHFADEIDASIITILPPSIIGLGSSSGFTLELKDMGDVGHEKLIEARDKLLYVSMQNPDIAYVRPTGLEDTVQYNITIDNQLATSLGLAVSEVSSALSAFLGGSYVNDFIDDGRVKKVFVQVDTPYRMTPDNLRTLSFRNRQGDMVPFSSIATAEWITGPALLERYNSTPSVEIQGEAAHGVSSGDAMKIMEKEVANLGSNFALDWTGLSYQEEMASGQTVYLFILSAIAVFLVLAALYESWSIPLAVILIVPLGILGAVIGVSMRGIANDIYFHVGILAVMGLAAKNAILVVEFARTLQKEGASLLDAAQEAARLRLRPILMTSLAFALGVAPMLIATGPGAASQRVVGTTVFSGTIVATALGIFFIPILFVVVALSAEKIFKKKEKVT